MDLSDSARIPPEVKGMLHFEDGKLSCGYSSFRGKRATMEDCYDIKTSNINGRTVCLFGIFDGIENLELLPLVLRSFVEFVTPR
ncbi:hypothetical protein V6N13_077335 [Hibiscus sabdariffa]